MSCCLTPHSPRPGTRQTSPQDSWHRGQLGGAAGISCWGLWPGDGAHPPEAAGGAACTHHPVSCRKGGQEGTSFAVSWFRTGVLSSGPGKQCTVASVR